MRFIVMIAVGFLGLLGFIGFISGFAHAKAVRVYTVSNVGVEARASTAVDARQAAILEGHGVALTRLLQRLTLPEDWPRLPVLSGKDAQLLSIGYALLKEKNSTTRYIAQISVRFDPDRVRKLLQESDIPFGDIQLSPALVIPVYDLPNGRRVVWEDQNIWRKAWSRSDIGESLTPFILPVGDIEDIISLPTQAARLENREALFKIAKRYNAPRVLLAHARLVRARAGNQAGYALGVTLNVLAPDARTADEQMEFSVIDGKDPQQLMDRGVSDILRMTGIVWKRRVIVYHDEVGEREIIVNFESLVEWARFRQKIDKVPILRSYQVRRLDGQSALLTINYSGSRNILALALAQQDIDLIFPENENATEDDKWQMRLRK